MWGKEVQVSKMVGKDTPAVEIKGLVNFSQKHTNFHSSMTAEELVGIIDLMQMILYIVSQTLQKQLQL